MADRSANSVRRAAQRVCLAVVAVMLLAPTGCMTWRGLQDNLAYNPTFDEFALGWRDYSWSSQAWRQHRPLFKSQAHQRDFAAGFKAGFVDVSNGGTGCTPSMPPRKYWSWRYQTAEGQAKMGAWFAGYPHGAQAAEQAGVPFWSGIQLNHSMQPLPPDVAAQGLYLPSEGYRPPPLDGQRLPEAEPLPEALPNGADPNGPPNGAVPNGLPNGAVPNGLPNGAVPNGLPNGPVPNAQIPYSDASWTFGY